MKRKWVLVILVVAPVVGMMVMYSLVGVMTGIYRVPGGHIWDDYGGTAYLLRGRSSWRMVWIDRTEPSKPFHDPGPIPSSQKFPLQDGIWIIKLAESKEAGAFYAFTPWDLVDVYQLKFGKYRHLLPENQEVQPDQ